MQGNIKIDLHRNDIWKTSFLCLLVLNAPGFDGESFVPARIFNLSVIAHCSKRWRSGGESHPNKDQCTRKRL